MRDDCLAIKKNHMFMAKGKLTQNKVHLKQHEYETVKLLLEQGYDVELIPPSGIKGLQMPDIIIHGVAWEMKSPEGSGKYTLKNAIQGASHQSQNVIIDLRRSPMEEQKSINELVRRFQLSHRLRRMKLICKDNKILDYTK